MCVCIAVGLEGFELEPGDCEPRALPHSTRASPSSVPSSPLGREKRVAFLKKVTVTTKHAPLSLCLRPVLPPCLQLVLHSSLGLPFSVSLSCLSVSICIYCSLSLSSFSVYVLSLSLSISLSLSLSFATCFQHKSCFVFAILFTSSL